MIYQDKPGMKFLKPISGANCKRTARGKGLHAAEMLGRRESHGLSESYESIR